MKYLILLVFLCGCSSAAVKPVEVQKELVPVEVCHLPAVPPKPDLAIERITDTTPPDEEIKIYVETILQLEGYVDQLRTLFVNMPSKADSTGTK